MSWVKEIELIFENCESYKLNRNVIGNFVLSDIETVVARVAANAIDKYQVAKTVVLELFSEGNVSYAPFGMEEKKYPIFERIAQWNDITGIDVVYEDGTKDSFLTDYDSGDDDSLGASNNNQKTYTSDLGNLYIVISQNKGIDDFFDKETINNKDEIDFEKDMMDIGVDEEIERELGPDSLPDLYRYVYLSNENTQALAVRVPDPDCEWKFVFDEDGDVLHFPKTWQYPNSKMNNFLKEYQKSLDIEELKKKYPLPQ